MVLGGESIKPFPGCARLQAHRHRDIWGQQEQHEMVLIDVWVTAIILEDTIFGT